MNFERVPEHEILRDSVREFFARAASAGASPGLTESRQRSPGPSASGAPSRGTRITW